MLHNAPALLPHRPKTCTAPFALAVSSEGPTPAAPHNPENATRKLTSRPERSSPSSQVRNSLCSGMSHSAMAGLPTTLVPPRMAHPAKSVKKHDADERQPPAIGSRRLSHP